MTSTQDCDCGNQIKSLKDVPRNQLMLERSFVHLDSINQPINTLHDTETLLKVIEGRAVEEDIWLCVECLERAARAIEADIDRLNNECTSYDRELNDREERQKNLERTLCNDLFPSSSGSKSGENQINRIEKEFLDEVDALRQAIEQQENELLHLKKLKKEQEIISEDLDSVEELFAQEENEFELEAQSMSHIQKQLCNTLNSAQSEIEKLTSADVSLFSLVIDKRGLRYPLINELRLAFSPKGDLSWEEIQVAWSQVAQLLLFMNLKHSEWRIIPLTSCAKIIHGESVYNLGKDMVSMAKALKALASMLQLSSPSLPFPITELKIGDVTITDLPNSDHPGWSRLIHYLACNLQHLSEKFSETRRNNIQELLL